MAHHGFCDASQYPTAKARASITPHRNQIIRKLTAQRRDLVCSQAFWCGMRDFRDSEPLQLRDFFLEVISCFISRPVLMSSYSTG